MKLRLTDTFITRRKLEKGEQIDVFDIGQPGLILRMSYGGARTFRVRCRDEDSGKFRTHKIGRWDPETFSVENARAAARRFDPSQTKTSRSSNAGLSDEQAWWLNATFSDVAEKYIAEVVAHFRTRKETERCIRVYALPAIGACRFLDVKKSDVAALRRTMGQKNGLRQAEIVFAMIRSIMMWVEDEDVLDEYQSPLRYRPKKRGNRKRQAGGRDRVLDDDELRMVWTASTEMGGLYGALVRLLILTAQRRQCLATAKWSEISDGVWHVRDEANAKGTGQVLTLPPLALSILGEIPRIKGNPYVFGVVHKEQHKAFNSFSQRNDELKALLPRPIPRWTLHDLRRTARTRMEDIGIDMQTGEVVLGHALPGVKRTYIRSQFKEKRADALLRLSQHIAEVVGLTPTPVADSSNVVPLARARRA